MYINGCFEGGGVKGLTYVGALRYLEERGFKFFKVSGTSVGSIFAALISVGYNSKEIEEVIEKIDFRVIANKNRIAEGIKNRGLYSIDLLEDILYYLFFFDNKSERDPLKPFLHDYILILNLQIAFYYPIISDLTILLAR